MSAFRGRQAPKVQFTPIMPWDSEAAHDPEMNVVWWSRLDKEYQVEVQVTEQDTHVLIIFNHSTNEVVHTKEVFPVAGARFGSDVRDVEKWKKLAADLVDEKNVLANMRRSLGEDIKEMTEFLIDNLGQRIPTFVVGLKDADIVKTWRDGTAQPSAEQQEKLSILYDATRRIVDRHDSQTARAYLVGTHDDLEPNNVLLYLAQATDLTGARANIMAEVYEFLNM